MEYEIKRDAKYVTALDDIVGIEGAYEFREVLRRPDFEMTDKQQQVTLSSGLEASAIDYIDATRSTVAAAKQAFREAFRVSDVILSVSRPQVARLLDQPRGSRDVTKMSDLLGAAGNLAGVPGISFPCGLSDERMPVGLQLTGPRGSDARLLGLVAEFQRRTEYHLLRPPDPTA